MLAQTLEYSGTKVDYTLVDVCRYIGAEACYEPVIRSVHGLLTLKCPRLFNQYSRSQKRREEFEDQRPLDYVHSEPFVEVTVIRVPA